MNTMAPHMAMTKQDMDNAVDNLVRITETLSALMEHERALMHDRKYRELEKIQPEKSRLAAEYRLAVKALAPYRDLLAHEFSDLRDQLLEANNMFQEKVKENGRLLLRSKSLTEGIVNAVAEEANRLKPRLNHYTPNQDNGGKSKSSLSIAFNETV